MPFSSDTSPEAREVVIEALRRASPEQRLQMAMEQTEFVRQMVIESVHRDFPTLSEEERHSKFLERWLGEDLGRSVAEHRRRARRNS